MGNLKGLVRVTYRSEIYVKANSKEEALEVFENLSNKELRKNSDFVEVVSVEVQE